MTKNPTLRICLEPGLLDSALAGEHNFINLLRETAEMSQFRIEYHLNSDEVFLQEVDEETYTLSHMKQPPHPRGLVFRRVYHYPFWQIDQTAARWDWDVASATFDPSAVHPAEAAKFAAFWKRRLFGDAPTRTVRDRMIYVPLQGKLGRHRSFQICSPLEMLDLTMQHAQGHQVVATLHPKEEYTPADLSALGQLENQHPQLTVTMGGMEHHLQRCDFVVTQNSSAAFNGYFFGKPALLFAQIDFHHIAVRADLTDMAGSFAKAAQARPDFDSYLWWFWQSQSINAGRGDASAKIAARFKRFGWPMQ